MPNPKIEIILACQSGGRSIPLARLADRGLASQVARAAVNAQDARAEEIGRADRWMGKIEAYEARRLRDVLGELGLLADASVRFMM